MAIDIGTSSTRAALVDTKLAIKSIGASKYTLSTPRPGWAEQNPHEIVSALDSAVRRCLADAPSDAEVVGIALDSAMHSLIGIGSDDAPLTNAWTWADMRAAQTAKTLADRSDARELYRRTGCPVHAMYFPAKIGWLRANDQALFDRIARFSSIKSYLLHHLTGEWVEDLSIASGNGLLNIDDLTWDPLALEIAGIATDRLPRVVEPGESPGLLRKELADAWGLGQLPIIAGGADGPLANVGAGCIAQGDMAITVGTSSAVRMFSSVPCVDDDARTWGYYLGDATWVVGGAINGGASTLDWLVKTFPGIATGPNVHESLDQMAASVSPGSEGLILAPYLAGERNPGWQGEARGYLAGLGLHHAAPHFVRAVMEGIAYQIAWVYEAVADVADVPERIRITGGFVASSTWPQVLADVLGRTLEVPAEKEGSLIGCAAIGLEALIPDLKWRTLVGEIPVQASIHPDMAAHERYKRFYDAYKQLYGAMKPHFGGILALQG